MSEKLSKSIGRINSHILGNSNFTPYRETLEFICVEATRLTAECTRLQSVVDSYDRQDELLGTEFEGVDEVTDIIRLLKQERDTLTEKLLQIASEFENEFIIRLENELQKRGVDTSGWDGDDDPAQILAQCITALRDNAVYDYQQSQERTVLPEEITEAIRQGEMFVSIKGTFSSTDFIKKLITFARQGQREIEEFTALLNNIEVVLDKEGHSSDGFSSTEACSEIRKILNGPLSYSLATHDKPLLDCIEELLDDHELSCRDCQMTQRARTILEAHRSGEGR